MDKWLLVFLALTSPRIWNIDNSIARKYSNIPDYIHFQTINS